MAPRKQPWFRFYTETIRDSKIRRLPVSSRWCWAAIMCLARESPISGYLALSNGNEGVTPLTVKDISDAAALRQVDVRSALNSFQVMGMLTHDPAVGCLYVTRFTDRQYESDDVGKRVQKHRECNDDRPLHQDSMKRSLDVSCNNYVTATETETETENFSHNNSDLQRARVTDLGETKIQQLTKRYLAHCEGEVPPKAVAKVVEHWLTILDFNVIDQAIGFCGEIDNKPRTAKFLETLLEQWAIERGVIAS